MHIYKSLGPLCTNLSVIFNCFQLLNLSVSLDHKTTKQPHTKGNQVPLKMQTFISGMHLLVFTSVDLIMV